MHLIAGLLTERTLLGYLPCAERHPGVKPGVSFENLCFKCLAKRLSAHDETSVTRRYVSTIEQSVISLMRNNSCVVYRVMGVNIHSGLGTK